MISKFAAHQLRTIRILNKVASYNKRMNKDAAANEDALKDLHGRLSKLDPGTGGLILGTVPDSAWEVLKNLPANVDGSTFTNNNVSIKRKKIKHLIDRRINHDGTSADAVVSGIRNILNNPGTKHKTSVHYGPPIDTLYVEKPGNMYDFMSIARNHENKNPDVLTYYDFPETDTERVFGKKE